MDEPPLQVIPSLAVAIGLNEAIFVQQVHYYLKSDSGKVIDGTRWIHNTREQWITQFPFWSESTLKRIIQSLRSLGVIKTSSDFNQMKMDKTLWYTIDYGQLQKVTNEETKSTVDGVNMNHREGQYEPKHRVNMTQAITRDSQESPAETQSPYSPPTREGNATPKQAPRKPGNRTDSGSRNEPKQPQVSAPPAPTEVLHFSAAYPSHRRGGSNADLIAAWERAKSEATTEQLFAALEKYKASWKWTNEPQYIPGIVKWLGEGRWRVEPEPAPYTPPPAPGHLHPKDGQNTMIWGVDY
jgi:hypothetical protein